MNLLKFLPLVIFLIVSIFLYNKLKFQKKLEPLSSALIQKKVPSLQFKNLDNNQTINEFIKDRFVIINIFASWCAPCRVEHEVLKSISLDYSIIGIAYKDSVENIESFLKELGNPYAFIGKDINGKQSVRFGIYGIPESILINKNLLIMKKFVGPLTSDDLSQIVEIIN